MSFLDLLPTNPSRQGSSTAVSAVILPSTNRPSTPAPACAFAGGAHGLRHDIDAGYLLPALNQADTPTPGPASEIERASVGWLATAFFSFQKRDRLFAYGPMGSDDIRSHGVRPTRYWNLVEQVHTPRTVLALTLRFSGDATAPSPGIAIGTFRYCAQRDS